MKRNAFFWTIAFLLISSTGFGAASADTVINISNIPEQGLLLDKGWKFHAGDNPAWVKSKVVDDGWKSINPAQDIYFLPQVRKAEIGWFRLKLHIDSSLVNESLAFNLYQAGASEIYLNGRLIYSLGIVNKDYEKERTQQTYNLPFTIRFDNQPTQTIAIRYSFTHKNFFINYIAANPCLQITLNKADRGFAFHQSDYEGNAFKEVVIITLYALIGLMSLFLYFSFRTQKTYFYFGLYCIISAVYNVFILMAFSLPGLSTSLISSLYLAAHIFSLFTLVILLEVIYIISKVHNKVTYYFLFFYAVFSIASFFFLYTLSAIICFLFYLIGYIEVLRSLRIAVRKKIPSSLILLIVFVCVVILEATMLYEFGIRNFRLAYAVGVVYLVSLPIGLSFFLAGEYARTGRSLQAKVVEVEQLSQKTIAQEQEKQQILADQNIVLERQVTERTAELNQSLRHLKSTQTQLIQSEKMASLGELTAGIAHEIQNPLNFVNNFSEINTELVSEMKGEIEKGDLEEIKAIASDIEENSKKINMHGKRADAIVKGMLQHSKVGNGAKEPTNINALVEECMRLAYHGLRAKDKSFNAELASHLDETLPKVNVIPQDMVRVMLNLFNNAFYAVNQKQKTAGADYKPTVEVSTELASPPAGGGGGLIIKVKDNGTGIPDAIKDKIMQPFFTTKPTGEGTGLGLSLTYDMVVKGHGGSIEVVTKERQFTEFNIKLPLN